MNTEIPAPLVMSQLRSLDAECDRFEDAWRSGQRPSIDTYLVQVEEAVQPALLAELVRLELEWRCRLGEQPSVEEYVQRYPSCQAELETWVREAQAATLQHGQSYPTLVPAPNSPVPKVSNAILGEYELLEPLGHGGMGEVWKARHRRLDKLVALKLITTGRRGDAQARSRFLREMKAVGRLEHPNLIEAHDAGEQDGDVYLVMKLLEGKDLARLVRECGPLPVSQACRLLRQAALGLQYLHEHGLVHRDIKPSNLMRLPDGTLKILDFGLAHFSTAAATEGMSRSGQVVGTPDYMAPEQIEATTAVDSRADLYSLGATLFFLLTGRPPFAHHTELWPKLDAHRQEPPPDVRQLRGDVPPALAELVARLLAKRPEDRPQTPAEAAAALASFSEEASTVDLPRGPLPQRRWFRGRLAWVVGMATAVGLVVVLGIALFWGPWNRPTGGFNGGDVTRPVHSALPLEVFRWEADFLESVNGVSKPRGLLGVSAFQPRLGDRLGRIEAELSEPAQAYLIAYRPDGQEDLCWPPEEDQPPPAVTGPRYPRPGLDVDYELSDGTGLQVFVLAASRRPLPAYREWKVAHGKAPWNKEKLPEVLAEVVWRDRGLGLDGWTSQHPFRPGGTPINRGKDAEKLGIGPLVRLKHWWREQEAIEVVAVLALTVGPR